MSNLDLQKLEEGIAISRQWNRQQLQNSFAMVASAALAYCLTAAAVPGPQSLALSIAAATGLTVGVCCAPNTYRSRNGSLGLAFALLAAMWTVPAVVVIVSLFG
ncbi:hypothetical protein [Novipirellula artificiosorum]|uniref:Uncharacterized protein n=1 Tax=Novipirellula artificiosorum TaxID=2528016 RepID=A0A5C6DKZ7_9BACT|nr:hypothetical protein [Novipirellula artificiosorum]TWU37448.1 hypothetical protein Poly41_35800 [Novipirellula artificiosorum]